MGQNSSVDKAENTTNESLKKSFIAGLLTPAGIELTKIILEFLSKSFYPALISVLLLIFYFSDIDLKSLFGRMQSS